MEKLDEYTNDPNNHLYQFIAIFKSKVKAAYEESKQFSPERLESLKKENEEVKKRLIVAELNRARYRKERNQMKDQIEKFKQEVKKFQYCKDGENLRRELEGLKKLYQEKEREWDLKMKVLEQTSAEKITVQKHKLENCQKDLKAQVEKSKQLQQKIEDSKFGFSDMDKLQKKLKESEGQLDETKHRLHQVSEILKNTQKELDDTKTRLSRAMGNKLTDNNPNIADLSDKDRPTKLAEKYAELYDNQWSDAFEYLANYFTEDENIIEILLEILLNVDSFCKKRAKQQLDDLKKVILCSKSLETTNFPADATKQLKDCRKITSSISKDQVYEMYLSSLRHERTNLKYALQTKTFVKGCLEVCWPMALQDPSVVFGPLAKYCESFQTEIYRPYVQSGPYIKYIVWPCLLLHEDGPLLAKGVAQGFDRRKHAWSEKVVKKISSHSRVDSDFTFEDSNRSRQKYTMTSRKPGHEPTASDMKLFFSYLDRYDYAGARKILGDTLYERCWTRANTRYKLF